MRGQTLKLSLKVLHHANFSVRVQGGMIERERVTFWIRREREGESNTCNDVTMLPN